MKRMNSALDMSEALVLSRSYQQAPDPLNLPLLFIMLLLR